MNSKFNKEIEYKERDPIQEVGNVEEWENNRKQKI